MAITVARRLQDFPGITGDVTLAMGFFDGLHRGHAAVIDRARSCAAGYGGKAWVLSFDPHPLRVLRPGQAPPLLTSTRHKIRLLEAYGVAGCLLLRFDRRTAGIPPLQFLENLHRSLPVGCIVVGDNWRFGRDQAGDAALLRETGRRLGFRTEVVKPVMVGGSPVSSTRVRRAVIRGDLDCASELLGRPFSLLGRVSHGRQAGHRLGFPTANIEPENEVLPPDGIYAAHAAYPGGSGCAAAYIGRRPTFADAGNERAVEVYLLDMDLDLYGRDIEVFFLSRVRGDQRFGSEDLLRRQIREDVDVIRRLHRSYGFDK